MTKVRDETHCHFLPLVEPKDHLTLSNGDELLNGSLGRLAMSGTIEWKSKLPFHEGDPLNRGHGKCQRGTIAASDQIEDVSIQSNRS